MVYKKGLHESAFLRFTVKLILFEKFIWNIWSVLVITLNLMEQNDDHIICLIYCVLQSFIKVVIVKERHIALLLLY